MKKKESKTKKPWKLIEPTEIGRQRGKLSWYSEIFREMAEELARLGYTGKEKAAELEVEAGIKIASVVTDINRRAKTEWHLDVGTARNPNNKRVLQIFLNSLPAKLISMPL